MWSRLLVVLAGMMMSASAFAGSLDISISDDSVRAEYATPFGAGEFNVGALYNDDTNDWLASAGLLALGERRGPGSRSEVGLGGKLYAGTVGDDELLALGLGGRFRWFPRNSIVGLAGFAYIAPDILTGADADRFWEAGLRLELEIVERTALLYLGYRKVETELKSGADVTLDKGGHVGIAIRF